MSSVPECPCSFVGHSEDIYSTCCKELLFPSSNVSTLGDEIANLQ